MARRGTGFNVITAACYACSQCHNNTLLLTNRLEALVKSTSTWLANVDEYGATYVPASTVSVAVDIF